MLMPKLSVATTIDEPLVNGLLQSTAYLSSRFLRPPIRRSRIGAACQLQPFHVYIDFWCYLFPQGSNDRYVASMHPEPILNMFRMRSEVHNSR